MAGVLLAVHVDQRLALDADRLQVLELGVGAEDRVARVEEVLVVARHREDVLVPGDRPERGVPLDLDPQHGGVVPQLGRRRVPGLLIGVEDGVDEDHPPGVRIGHGCSPGGWWVVGGVVPGSGGPDATQCRRRPTAARAGSPIGGDALRDRADQLVERAVQVTHERPGVGQAVGTPDE